MPDMGELLTDYGNVSWAEPDPDDLAFPGRDRAALWSDLSSNGEPPEVEAPTNELDFLTECIFSLFKFTYPGSIWHESRLALQIPLLRRTSNLQHSFNIGLTSSLFGAYLVDMLYFIYLYFQ
jgi:hypothetical protein